MILNTPIPSAHANHVVCASKFVDSHLKPYRCKVVACENLHFSSTACLLRHEREAHAMHGHGDKPFLCTYDGCERGLPGNGFPRQWNLRDHMKRVHNDQPKSPAGTTSPPVSAGPIRGKKRKADEKLESQSSEKSTKRVATSPVVVHQPQKPTLTEHYDRVHQKATEILEQLSDPKDDARNLTLIYSLHDCLKVMAQTSKRINGATATGPSAQLSQHRG